jgi:hypothetical protein
LEVGRDPRLRIPFGFPPKDGPHAVAPGIAPRGVHKAIESLDSESLVVMFPVVAMLQSETRG